ncbi:hypothetical protein DYB37_010046 [Aphanomyces astaci]|uniref:Uncharacterized protein n=1 Tax=Aphanomyces astaci TaxID=112090 RepID=A0A3R6WNW3_APHAT|nr:hypothetical protein DYB35_010323 [Aphanomyces astaci]RHZ27600.1 hypothetical protein DYB37_010046 [Aphanomyces astaci]
MILATVGLDKDYDSVKVMLAFQSCIIPAMLLICFEVAYLVHKNRSVNFCGISFDSGHRTHRDDCKSTFLRFAMWLVGLGLLTLKLLVYYRYYDDIVFTSGIYEVNGSATVGTVLTIIPAFSLVVLAIYIGMRLWNYGSNYAYTVHSTCFNPWIWMMVGSFLLAAGYLMPDPLFARTSNGGEICMLAAIIRMFREVHKDLQEGTEIANTLLDGSAAGLHDHATSPRSMQDSSPSTSAASSSHAKYDLIGSPRRTMEETRLTDAHTDAYLSVVIARTKEASTKPMTVVPPWKRHSNDEFVDVALNGPSRPVPMLQELKPKPGSVHPVASTGLFDDMPLMDFPPASFFGSMNEETEVTVYEATHVPLDLLAETDSVAMSSVEVVCDSVDPAPVSQNQPKVIEAAEDKDVHQLGSSEVIVNENSLEGSVDVAVTAADELEEVAKVEERIDEGVIRALEFMVHQVQQAHAAMVQQPMDTSWEHVPAEPTSRMDEGQGHIHEDIPCGFDELELSSLIEDSTVEEEEPPRPSSPEQHPPSRDEMDLLDVMFSMTGMEVQEEGDTSIIAVSSSSRPGGVDNDDTPSMM